jgi:glycosyltransferase involved in cell wall biosynthesis
MRIGIVTATYPPSRNGVATSTQLFARGLRQLGHEVRIFAPAYPRVASEPGVIRLPSLTRGMPPDYPVLLPLSPTHSRSLPIHDLELVHTMHPFVAGRIAALWSRRLRVPLVFTAHTQYHSYVHYAPTPPGLTRWAVKQHVKAFAQQADAVLAPGQAMIDVLRSYGYQGPITLMPNPVELSAFAGLEASGVRARFGIAEDHPLLIYVGRIGEEKNLGVLLNAFEQARLVRPELHLLLVGDGPLKKSLSARLRPQVHWVGAVAHAQVPIYLTAAELFATASITEVQPMTFLEAFAAGLPIVAARSAAADELITPGVNGLTSEANAMALCTAILSLLAMNPTALRRGARETARTFAVEARAQALAAHYRQVLAGFALAKTAPRTRS